MKQKIELIGVYSVRGHQGVHLIELNIYAPHTAFDVGKFTQSQVGINPLNWQVPWDEKYLDAEGVAIIGDWLDAPTVLEDTTRLAFFFHLLDFNQPLLTPFGDIDLKRAGEMPERLASIVVYEAPD